MDDINRKNGSEPDADLDNPQEYARFRAAVQRGIEQADRGELIEEEEMDDRVKRWFPS